jgi:hypothetical protein
VSLVVFISSSLKKLKFENMKENEKKNEKIYSPTYRVGFM